MPGFNVSATYLPCSSSVVFLKVLGSSIKGNVFTVYSLDMLTVLLSGKVDCLLFDRLLNWFTLVIIYTSYLSHPM